MLAELLEPSAIVLNYAAQDAEDVIRVLSARLLATGHVRESFADAALARESELPTGLMLAGEIHAAIPHTDVEHVLRPAVALATLQKPVMFRHMIDPTEEIPVRLVFLLALEQPKSQVAMLQEVAIVLQNSQLITQLMSASSVSAVQQALAQNHHDS
ncbi:MAG: PTS sugar transporter subunit IIA [Chloroflexi bacterium]|nr:PTS sugar transporter subunit IIA [Chloroflexota bacterium]